MRGLDGPLVYCAPEVQEGEARNIGFDMSAHASDAPLTRAYDPAAVEALIAVTPVEPAEDVETRADRLLAGVIEALGARGGAVEALDERAARLHVVATRGLPPAAAEGLGGPIADGLAGRALAEGHEVEVGEADAGGDVELLPAGLADAGLRHALALPARVRERALGVVWAAGPEPLQDDPVRRHAARVAAEAVGALLEQSRLYENLERAMAQILESDERLLGRIGLDIHDGPTQALSVALLEVQLLEADLDDAERSGANLPSKLRPGLARVYETLGGALTEMRELIGHLRPTQFEDRRLADILDDAVRVWELRTEGHVGLSVSGDTSEEGLSISHKITLYRILQESLANAYRHGGATEVDVAVTMGPAGTTLEVRDGGAGFDPSKVREPRPGMPNPRFGVYGMRDRAHLLGGSFEIRSRPGDGAAVRVFLPRWHPPARADELPAT
jgi:two-component system, NarL family, sensor histidine kinase UhpB